MSQESDKNQTKGKNKDFLIQVRISASLQKRMIEAMGESRIFSKKAFVERALEVFISKFEK